MPAPEPPGMEGAKPERRDLVSAMCCTQPIPKFLLKRIKLIYTHKTCQSIMEASSFLSFSPSHKTRQFPGPFSVISKCISGWDNIFLLNICLILSISALNFPL